MKNLFSDGVPFVNQICAELFLVLLALKQNKENVQYSFYNLNLMVSNPVQAWIFFRLLFASYQVLNITAMIIDDFIFSSAVQIYDLS